MNMLHRNHSLSTSAITRAHGPLAALWLAALAASSVQGAFIVKTNNTDNLNLASSWTNGVTPGAGDVAVWDSTVSAVNTTNTLGASMSWRGIRIVDPGGPVVLITNSSGNTLTNGAAGLDMSAASQTLTLSNNVNLGTLQNWNVAAGQTLTAAGALAKSSGAALRFGFADATAQAFVMSGTASALLGSGSQWYATVNDIDFAALNASKQVVGGATPGALSSPYTPNPTGATPTLNIGSSGAITNVVDCINSGNSYGFRPGNSYTFFGVRFNTAQASPQTQWQVLIDSANRTITTSSVLVTSNVGPWNVVYNTSASGAAFRISSTGTSEFMVFQNNPFGSLIFTGAGAGITQQGTGVFTKMGVGTAEIQCATAYSGGTRLYEGTLRVNGTNAGVGSGTLNAFGGTFDGVSGSGIVPQAIFFSGATNQIEVNAANGQFRFGSNVTLSAGSRVQLIWSNTVALSTTAAPMLVTNLNTTLSATNQVNLDVLGALAVGQFPLIKYTGALGGDGFAAFNLATTPPHMSASLSNNVANNSIDLVVASVNEPLKWAVGNGTWDINGTANWKDTLGASTTYQQVGPFADSVVFDDSASGTSPISILLNTNATPASVTINATKNYNISGGGTIGGACALTKQNSGTLTLSTSDSFTGGVNINGGVFNFLALTNLGGGAISFGGGTLQYASGNSDDISVRTVTLGAGGGAIDTAANTVSFARPIGNNGAGGLTKLGSGSLTLSGTNRYLGNTVISNGTAALAASTYISNSAAIIVKAGALLDVTASGLTLSAPASQILAGAGSVNGNVTARSGTTISPATNGVVGTLTIGDSVVTNGTLSVNGGTLVFDISTNLPNDLIVVNGDLALTNGTVQVLVTGNLTNGNYRLIQYSRNLLSGAGSAANLVVSGFSQAGKVAALSDATNNEIDLVVSSSGGTNLWWQGDGGSNLWDVEITADWTNQFGVPLTFVNGDFVTFDDSSANLTASLAGALSPGGVTNNSAASYTLQDGTGTGAGKIGGSGGLTKSGSGTLAVLTVNNNTGPTVINGGTIQVGNGTMTGDLGSGNITNNAALVYNQPDSRTVPGQISGTGTLTQQGAAVLTLAQNNTYNGLTTISSGMLQVGNGGAAGSLGGGSVVDNSFLVLNRSGAISLPNSISGSGGISNIGPAVLTLNGVYSYQNNTYLNNGTTVLGANDLIPDGLNVVGSTGWLILDGGSTAGVLDLNGFNEMVNALAGLGGAVVGVITNSSTAAATNVLTVLGSAGTTYNGIIGGNPSGSKIQLVLKGARELRLNGPNSYVGGTIVGDTATIGVGPGGTIGASGSPLVLSNGTTLFLHNNGGTGVTDNNAVTIPDNSQATFTTGATGNGFNGTISGGATATNMMLNQGSQEVSLSSQNLMQHQSFSGTVLVPAGSGLRFSGSSGLANGGTNTTFDVEGTMHTRNAGTVTLGALEGNGTINSPTVSPAATWIIGTKGIDSEFDGTFTGSNSLIKAGSATLTMGGTVSHLGNTTVSNGVLALTVDTANLDGCPAISIKAAGTLDISGHSDGSLDLGNARVQTLSGAGTIRGSLKVIAGSGCTVTPGDSIGTLTVTNAVALATDSTLIMEINSTNTPNNSDRIVAGASIAYDGTLTVTNIGPTNLTGGTIFKLFSAPVYSGAFAVTNLPPLPPPLYWTNNVALDGTIEVEPVVNTTPTNITASVIGGTNLVLSWPADHTGWRLQVQTNSTDTGLSNNWSIVPGSGLVNIITNGIDPNSGTVFYRMIYP